MSKPNFHDQLYTLFLSIAILVDMEKVSETMPVEGTTPAGRAITHTSQLSEFHTYRKEDLASMGMLVAEMMLLSKAVGCDKAQSVFPARLAIPSQFNLDGQVIYPQAMARNIAIREEDLEKIAEYLDWIGSLTVTIGTETSTIDGKQLFNKIKKFHGKLQAAISNDNDIALG